jgi:ribosomal protein L11
VTDAHCTRRITVSVDHPRVADGIRANGNHTESTRLSGYASQRELIDLAKTMDLDAIVRKTGRTPQNILTSAKRLGLSIKGRK